MRGRIAQNMQIIPPYLDTLKIIQIYPLMSQISNKKTETFQDDIKHILDKETQHIILQYNSKLRVANRKTENLAYESSKLEKE